MSTTSSNAVRRARGTAAPADGSQYGGSIASREPALYAAALAEGLDPEGAVLLSNGRSRVYRLPAATWKGGSGVVAKIHARGHALAAAQQCAVAYWVRSEGVQTPRPLRRQPITSHGGVAVSFWEDFGDGGRATPTGLAGVLSDLHSLPEPPDFLGIRLYQPFTDLHVRVRALRDLAPTVRGHLIRELQALAAWWNVARWPTKSGVIHTALSPRETTATASGTGLLDLADLRIGPPMVDLASVALQQDVYANDPALPHQGDRDDDPDAAYEAFHQAYGVDVMRFADGRPYRALRWIHILTGCIDALERATGSSAWCTEGDYRLSCVRGDEGDPPWYWRTAAEMAEVER
ncbi:phosphotransferase [Streptomyces sp. NRRL S-350]|uniref:phosphotransferase n=1 Tax=Streptomyces sp. NRRL S-350 TaxID=1463902 RepID=UPI000AFCF8D7|nr:phosphotransferase [Streptomyces sp. NRRL S-350]